MRKLYDRTATASQVLDVMRRHQDNRGRLALSTRKLGALAGLSHSTVRMAIADLAARGAVSIRRRGGSSCQGDPGVYDLRGRAP